MKIKLKKLPDDTLGIYGASKDLLGARQRYLHPFAARSLARIVRDGLALHLSDVYRSPVDSLRAVREKVGVKAPGYSGHNFGFSVDIDVRRALTANGWSKREMDAELEKYGWFCHRLDHRMGIESWHYNYLGEEDLVGCALYLEHVRPGRTTARALEAKIQAHYGAAFAYDTAQLQRYLSELKMYTGEIDGDAGPLTEEAVRVFQRAWGIKVTGVVSAEVERVVAVVAAGTP